METLPTNKDRAERARKVIAAYAVDMGVDEAISTDRDILESYMSDLMADFAHLCDDLEIDFHGCVGMALVHHDAEA